MMAPRLSWFGLGDLTFLTAGLPFQLGLWSWSLTGVTGPKKDAVKLHCGKCMIQYSWGFTDKD